jgi:hypothetical protein
MSEPFVESDQPTKVFPAGGINVLEGSAREVPDVYVKLLGAVPVPVFLSKVMVVVFGVQTACGNTGQGEK